MSVWSSFSWVSPCLLSYSESLFLNAEERTVCSLDEWDLWGFSWHYLYTAWCRCQAGQKINSANSMFGQIFYPFLSVLGIKLLLANVSPCSLVLWWRQHWYIIRYYIWVWVFFLLGIFPVFHIHSLRRFKGLYISTLNWVKNLKLLCFSLYQRIYFVE